MAIVKVQLPLDGSSYPALVYAYGRSNLVAQELTPAVLQALGDDKGGYFEATLSNDRRRWVIGARVEGQEW